MRFEIVVLISLCYNGIKSYFVYYNMQTFHFTARAVILTFLSLASVNIHAAETVRISPLPPSQKADKDEAAAFEPQLWNSSQSEFFLLFSLDVTASNNLEIAFWDDSKDTLDTASVIGWDCGEIFIYDGFVRAVADFQTESERLAISVRVRLSAQGEPSSTVISANGFPLEFYDSNGESVGFIYSPEWNAAQVASRGFGVKDERVVMGFDRDPFIIKVK